MTWIGLLELIDIKNFEIVFTSFIFEISAM
jgi:hypothetical protein